MVWGKTGINRHKQIHNRKSRHEGRKKRRAQGWQVKIIRESFANRLTLSRDLIKVKEGVTWLS